MLKTYLSSLLIGLVLIWADSLYARTVVSNAETGLKQDVTELRAKVLATYESQVGLKEDLGSNDSNQIRAYLKSVGIYKTAYYCAAFVCWGFTINGIDNPKTGWSPSLFPKNHVIDTKQTVPEPCDVFGVYFHNYKRIAHVGVIKRWPRDSEHFISIEANTNDNGSRNGDGIYQKRRLKRTASKISRWIA
jgi:hypothetical protein